MVSPSFLLVKIWVSSKSSPSCEDFQRPPVLSRGMCHPVAPVSKVGHKYPQATGHKTMGVSKTTTTTTTSTSTATSTSTSTSTTTQFPQHVPGTPKKNLRKWQPSSGFRRRNLVQRQQRLHVHIVKRPCRRHDLAEARATSRKMELSVQQFKAC